MNTMATLAPERSAAASPPTLRERPFPGSSKPTLLHFIASVDGGGAEALLRNLVARMNRRRWRVVIVALDARPWPEASAFLKDHCEAFHDLESSAFLQKPTLAKLKAVLRDERPSIMQTWMHHADLVGGLVGRWTGVPRIVWSLHCREIHRSPGDTDLKMALFRLALGVASRFIPSAIVSCSQAAMEDHRRLGYPASKMRWIPNGIDTSRFVTSATTREQMRQELEIPVNAPVVGFIGRFHEMKDLKTLFRAVSRMQDFAPDTHFVLCGGTAADLDEATHQLWRNLARIENVHFVPFRSDPESLYPMMDVFTLTSRTEACPMTILEAMSCGVPCVTSDVGDCGALLDGTGVLVSPGDHHGFQKGWSHMLNMPAEEKHDLNRRVRNRALEHFTINRAAEAYTALYEELLPTHAG